MCGILGFSGDFSRASLSSGLRAIAHRGPDDSGLFTNQNERIGLGHVRLSILDLSPLGHQPMVSADGHVVLIFNGEIYNFRELRQELEALGILFRGHSDTEVLLNLYLHEGEKMLTRLNGIFAFAIWDRRNRSLLIARDALGVKPLYYAVTNEGVAFASEIKGLLKLARNIRELDSVALHRYLSFLWCPGDGTPLKAVRKVLPGEAMLLREGRIERRWIWYRLPIFRGVVGDLDETAAREATLSQLRRAVRRQMVADVPVGAFLSGGLDSSAIVALGREVKCNLRCFTIDAAGGQEEGATNDLPYARSVAEYLGVPLDVVQISADRMAGDLERMVETLDEPLADPASLNVLYISELARANGIKVLLSGTGGDDLFAGYRRHHATRLDTYLARVPRVLLRAMEFVASRLDRRRVWAMRLAKMCDGLGLSGDMRRTNYFVWSREDSLFDVYTKDFRAQIGESLAVEPLLDFLSPLPSAVESVDRMLALEQGFFLPDHNLLYTDKMSMAAGVEVRVPFLDLEMVELAAHIPARLKQCGSVGKWVLKKAMEPYLPHDVIYRSKSGFGAPLRRWMRQDIRTLMGDVLSAESLKRRGLFDSNAVQQMIAANDAGRIDAAYTLLSLLCIEIWCRLFIDYVPGKEPHL